MDPRKLPPAVLVALGLQACTDKDRVDSQPCLSFYESGPDDSAADDTADDSGSDSGQASRAAVLERVEARLPADVAAKLRR